MKSFWMPRGELIDVRLNRERGKSVTILGGISNHWDDLKFTLAPKTSTQYVKEFLLHIKPHITRDPNDSSRKLCVMVLDNHKSHWSASTVDLAHELGIQLEYMPPTASELNPVERMWSFFKQRWRQKLYDPELGISTENAPAFIIETLLEVGKHSKSLAKGPMNHMLMHCNPSLWKD